MLNSNWTQVRGGDMKKISKKQAEDQLRKDAKQVTEEDLKTVLEKEDELASTFSKQEPWLWQEL